MPYTKTTWTDEIPASSPVKYEIVDDVLGEVAGSATIAPVTSITPGTALNATNLNKIETGIETAQAAAEAAIPKSTVTTSGDIIVATGSATVTRLAKGTAHQSLHMNSDASALAWRSRVLALISQSSSSLIAHNTNTIASFDTENIDTNSFFTSGSPTILTIPFTGYYRLTASFFYDSSTAGALRRTRITQGGSTSTAYATDTRSPATGSVFGSLDVIRQFTAGNTISLVGYQDSGGNLSFQGSLFIEFLDL